MCTFVLAASTLFVVSVVSAESNPILRYEDGLPVIASFKRGETCPAKKFYVDCNICSCLDGGKDAYCTLLQCPWSPEIYYNKDQLPRNDLFKWTDQCRPNKSFLNECNICKCMPNGKIASCSMMQCAEVLRPRIDGYQQGVKCIANKTFFDECNACMCAADGVSAVCTAKKCPNSRFARSTEISTEVEPIGLPIFYNYTQGAKCPGKYFFDDCNACYCNKDGVSATCTSGSCPTRRLARDLHPTRTRIIYPHIDNFEEIEECFPGEIFYDKCNTCTCGSDGKSAVCTLKGCPPAEKPRIDGYRNGRKCPPGKDFYNRCNVCKCGPDGRSAFCSNMNCLGIVGSEW